MVIFMYLIMKLISGLPYAYLAIPIILAAYHYHRYKGRGGILGGILLAIVIMTLIFSGLYLYLEYDRLVYTLWYTNLDLLVATIVLLFTLNYVRTAHIVLFLVIVALFIYASPYVGRMLPEPFFHLGLPWVRYITSNTLETAGLTSIFGTITLIVLEIIAPIFFLVGFMEGFGIIDSVTRVIVSYMRRVTLIPLLNPVLSSIIGTTTGSISTDTAVTGGITIPLMRKIGIPSEWAGAIAAVSGVTAYIMPPIMGTIAFIMPTFLGVTYWDVVVRAFIIAIAYVATIAIAIYTISAIYVKSPHSSEVTIEYRGRRVELIDYVNFVGFVMSITILIIMMGAMKYELPTAVYYTLIAFAMYFIPINIINSIAKGKNPESFAKELLTMALKGMSKGARTTIDIALLAASLGIMINLITAVGLIQDLNWLILEITGESLWILIAITYIFGLLMGLALPAVATYISVAVLLIPAMVHLGIDRWAAHFFAFYLAVVSEFTPPTSIAAVVAGGIAGCNPLNVMMRMLVLGLPVYLFPILILIYPQIVSAPSLESIVIAFIIFSISIGLTLPALLLTLRTSVDLRILIVLPLLPILAIANMLSAHIAIKVLLSSIIFILSIFILKLMLGTRR
jgi:TRAP transporter 4TM/12TM fusion protein